MAELDTNNSSNTKSGGAFFDISALPGPKAHLLFWPIVTAGVALDLWTKHAVFEWLRSTPSLEYSLIDGFLQFVVRENAGAAFSIAAGQTTMLITISIIALTVVIGIFLFGRIDRRLMQVGLALFTAGIIGNLYDRIFNEGFVRDFIDVYCKGYHWPAFNVADSMLCIGVGLLVIANITSTSSQRPAHRRK